MYTRRLLEAEDFHPRVLVQVFQKNESVLGGIDGAIAIVRMCSGREGPEGEWIGGWGEMDVRALHEGDEIAPLETVMTIEGDCSLFAHLETVYLGCLARRSLIMGNVTEVVEAAHGKPIFSFPARHDHWLVQTGDGGPRTWRARSWCPPTLRLRGGLDTSEQLVDRSLQDEMGGFTPTGVNPRLVEKVRGALDGAGFSSGRIVVSGGFNAERIRDFEAAAVPVDAYGVGPSLIRGENDFTADVVKVENVPRAKVARGFSPNPRLEQVQ